MTTLNQSVLTLSELQCELFDKLESSKNKKLISDEISSVLSKLCEEQSVAYGFDDYNNLAEEGREPEELIDNLYEG